jgi:hypothetical protein
MKHRASTRFEMYNQIAEDMKADRKYYKDKNGPSSRK